MKRVLLLSVLAIVTAVMVWSQSVETVRQFGQNLQLWTQTNNISYRIQADKMYGGKMKCIVANNLAKSFAKKYDWPENKSYEMKNFIDCIQKEIMDHGTVFAIDNIRVITADKVDGDVLRGYELAGGRFTSGGAFADEDDLFYLRDGKIVKVDNLVLKTDGKIHVDFSDLEHEESVGFTYNCGKHFKFGGSLIYSFARHCMLSVDAGVADEHDLTLRYRKIYDFNNVLNYRFEEGTYEPKFFVTVTPSYYMKYFSIGCGVGGMFFNGTVTERSQAYSQAATQNGTQTTNTNNKAETSEYKCKLMIRPTARVFIPCNGEWSIIVSGGYDYVFDFKDLNGYHVGLGLQYKFN